MAIPPRTMMGLPNSPSFRYKALNPAYQSDPRRILGQQLMQQGSSSAPVATPLQGLGRLSSALVGAYLQKGAIDRQVAREDEYKNQLANVLSGLNLSKTPILANYAQQFPEQALPIALSTEAKKATTKAPTTFRPMTDAEVKAAGYDTSKGQKYQINTLGKVQQIGGGSTNVNVSMNKDANKLLVEDYGELNKASRNANASLSSVNMLTNLLDEGIQTGFGAEVSTQFQKIGQFLNPDYKIKEIAGKEQFLSVVNELVLPRVKQLGYNPTDADLEFISRASPQLTTSVEGNRLILESIKLSESRKIRLFKYAADFIKKNPNLLEEGLKGKIKLDEYLQQVTETDELLKPNGEATLSLKTQLQSILPNAKIDELQNKRGSVIDNLKNKGLVK
jgi:hypothetical protein